MTYQETFAAAKKQARDILRIQMAGRVQERVSHAKNALATAIKALAFHIAGWNAIKVRDEKGAAKSAGENAAIRAEIERMPAANRDLALEAFDKEMADAAKDATRTAEQKEKDRAADLKRLEEVVTNSRAEYDRLLKVQKEVEDGTQKVDKDELLSLANKLVEEGRVNPDAEYS